MSKTFTYQGNPGMTYLFASGAKSPAPGDELELTDDEAASVGEDFAPAPKATPKKSPAKAADPTEEV